MKLFTYKNREQYLKTQIERSVKKSQYCKVYFSDVIRYRNILSWDLNERHRQKSLMKMDLKILCLGVRSGAEIDLFRAVFFGPLLRLGFAQNYASHHDSSHFGGPKIKLARLLGVGSGSPNDGRVIGVELNPENRRQDIWTGSFDELPTEWAGKFDLIYSNSIDHSQDPQKTITEWKRVAAPGAYVILAFNENKTVSDHDPLGGLDYQTLKDFWQSPIVYLSDTYNRNGYREICFLLGNNK